jgi:hypothetical protein
MGQLASKTMQRTSDLPMEVAPSPVGKHAPAIPAILVGRLFANDSSGDSKK